MYGSELCLKVPLSHFWILGEVLALSGPQSDRDDGSAAPQGCAGAWRGDQARDTGTGSVAREGGLRLLPSASALTYLETVVKAWRKEGS